MIAPGMVVDAIPPMNSGGRVNGIETKLSELTRREVVVNPTGSVVTVVCADNDGPPMQAAATTRRCDFRHIIA